MEKTKRNKILIIIASALVVAIVATTIGLVIAFMPKKALKIDLDKGAKAVDIVNNAQYVLDMDKFEENEPADGEEEPIPELIYNKELGSKIVIEQTEYNSFVNQFGKICNYSGAGKYLGYDIYEIKNELAFVIEKVPAFNQWFTMPTMREEQGYTEIPYYENWRYFIEFDETIKKLSVTRVCHMTRSSYINEDGFEVEEHDDDTAFRQLEVMKTNYYFNENNEEVVECFVYCVGIDNVRNSSASYNSNEKDYYPFEFIYFCNVKDSMMMKYHITATEREHNGMNIQYTDIYGLRTEFLTANYKGYNQINATIYDTEKPMDMVLDDINLKSLAYNFGVDEETYDNFDNIDEFITAVNKNMVDNFEIKNNFKDIYKKSSKSYKVELIEGPLYGKEMLIGNMVSYIEIWKDTGADDSNKYLKFSASASVIQGYDENGNIIDNPNIYQSALYSLSPAIMDNAGNIKVLANHFKNIDVGKNNIQSIQSEINIKKYDFLNELENGEYSIITVLVQKGNEPVKVVQNSGQYAYLKSHYFTMDIPSFVDGDGLTHKYTVKARAGKLTFCVEIK